MKFIIDSKEITIEDVHELIKSKAKLELSQGSIERIQKCREYLDKKVETNTEPIYGINTGFGSLCDIKVAPDELSELQSNLIISHACGTGEEVQAEIVKLIMFLKIRSLAYGNSGVQLITVQRLVDFYNNDILPRIYQQGSLGASGDLSPLAHMSLTLLGMGEVHYEGRIWTASEILDKFGWEPIRLQSKEGLALINGTQFMSAYSKIGRASCRERVSSPV